ncbi:MAG: inositol-3-phosphate synthase, partial [Deltaproteobacteria bacterium]|nr:inositol-3-phosphate synthase [Deltaproteobacteria bacterium]
MRKQPIAIDSPAGNLGILLVGLGAVSTTFIAGVEAVRRGLGQPFGSMTQMGRIRLGKRTEKKNPLVREFVPLAELPQLQFLAWDPIPDNAYDAAAKAGVLDAAHLTP